ncbi:MAG: GNAT family N-acetyltransferase [Rhodobiaceae bacterium]|nr:GNAT family N-acetyltransferase [Rhodobiaceae bacterium]MCC0047554.1 GNAT family N-acetyltransferase [Rhodobiaceae bacterium]
MTLRYEKLTGEALKAVIPDLARLRITVFRDWPYLYEGSEDYETKYLARYSGTPGALVVGAYDGGRLVGASTATPLAGEVDEFRAPFIEHGYDTGRVYYFGESILLPEYRGRGAGHAFFDHREAQARALGGFAYTAFCAVVRDEDDPRKPPGHRPLDEFWRGRGYQPVLGMRARFSWRETGEAAESEKALQFWLRPL